MKGDEKVIDYLNKALTNELTAINQYWLHYRVLDNWGVFKLAAYERKESIEEMEHADWLADRILFLDGLPNFQALHKLKVGESVKEVLEADLALEMEAIPLLREAADYCQQVKDFTSGQLFEKILRNEEEHVDFLEKQFDMIVRMGEQNYIQLQSAAAGEDGNEGGAWGLGGGDGNGN
ncbi:MAG: bacterioferritin [Erythrobacter sp.]|nr:bacterioferritin [Erythrobacter sp.]